MGFDSFWRLYHILLPYITNAVEEWRKYKYKEEGDLVKITRSVLFRMERLSPVFDWHVLFAILLAVRHVILFLFGSSYSGVLSSVWIIVHAINTCPDFQISYPDSLEAQMKIAAGFQKASTPGISKCAIAIDGILI